MSDDINKLKNYVNKKVTKLQPNLQHGMPKIRKQITGKTISNAIIDIHNIDSPVIVWKIENSLKKGKSTAPESDGIT